MVRGGCVYIMTNKNNTVLYTGASSNLPQRVERHKTKFFPNSFSARYNCDKIVYYENFLTIIDALTREKQIKLDPGVKKLSL